MRLVSSLASLTLVGSIACSVNPVPGEREVLYTINIVDRVKELIQTNPFGMETELAAWTVRGLYSGSFTYGQTQITSRHGVVNLVDNVL